ncbi:hypothetical protein EST38_g3928 [Candolleomyces aberdarensis]|uniref:Uncharacterized protein n=1 Tax=Candolleomyces aberdarensis TaxID=2316362 RepID=A0A4Q2DNR4_9AGAR|nr:hypothetical protein EST38_g3928 [Candolleomyces aberdarensis]
MAQSSIYRSTPTVPADIVTYQHQNKLVYVKPADTYELALDIAQKEFPEELANIPREKIGFAVLSEFVGEGKQRLPVRISESAWPSAVARLLRGEIIQIYIREANGKDGKGSKEILPPTPPPQYLDVPKVTFGGETSKSKGPASRQPRSTPTSRAGSPAHRENHRRSWFGGAR